jgi:demethylmenaquinone methyltransferase/2-methoxy-6-polyprenyl-1,4-benzoquinol methylase
MDAAMRAYYDRRAAEYDDWWNGTGLFASRDRPGWHAEVAALVEVLGALAPARTLDVACGTGFLTRHLPGSVSAIDQSPEMVAVARGRGIDAAVGDAFALEGEYERIFTAHFYGHLLPDQRSEFLTGARAVAGEVIVADSAGEGEEWQERRLNDGSTHRVYKRWFTGDTLAAEVGGEVLHAGRWFTVVRSRAPGATPHTA